MSLGLMPELVPDVEKFKILFFDVVSEYMAFVKNVVGSCVIWLILLILKSQLILKGFGVFKDHTGTP